VTVNINIFTDENKDHVQVVVSDFGEFEVLLEPADARSYAKALIEAADLIESGGTSTKH